MFLTTTLPNPILISFGPLTIYWYGIFIVSGIIAGMAIASKLAEKHGLKKEIILDLSFWLVIFGLLGARIYHVFFLQWAYYSQHLSEIPKIWQGGLAIHGVIFTGLILLYFMARKNKIDFTRLAFILVPGLAIGQAIGRWGNYFNQELFGTPTNLPWGIPIAVEKRPDEYIHYSRFHPAFLYESLGSLLIFIGLLLWHRASLKKNPADRAKYAKRGVAFYLIAYSLLRFSLEFLRTDPSPEILGWRAPQAVSLAVILLTIIWLLPKKKKHVIS